MENLRPYRYRHSPEMRKVNTGVHQNHAAGKPPEFLGAHMDPFIGPPPAETEGDYEHQAGLGEQGNEELNAGNGNPKSTGEAAPSHAGRGKRTHKSRIT